MSAGIRIAIVIFVSAVLSYPLPQVMAAETGPVSLRFSNAAPGAMLPPAWQYHALSRTARATRFTLVDDAGARVLQATADDAAGMVDHPLDLPAATTLAWRWKVDHAVIHGDLHRRSGDDFAARVYVFFDVPDSELGFGTRMRLKLARMLYGANLPDRALCYVWDNRAAVGTITASAYTSEVQMIVLESGNDHAGTWRTESRNLAADYRAAFHEAPPRISGVALGSDTDNTHGSAHAGFGDLVFVPAGAPP
ncbi:MAG: DUF3047 domain-containing protein [Rhodanobacteraceae bacterium]